MSTQNVVDNDWVNAIIGNAIREGQELEFKETLPDRSDKGTKEFIKDISAFANSTGGVILFGVAEEDDGRPRLAPLSNFSESPNDVELRLRSLADSLVEPRIQGLQFSTLQYAEGYVLALKIFASYGGPHWCGQTGHKRFVLRRGNLVLDYTHQELRAAFDRNSSALTRAREWVEQRLNEIREGRNTMPVCAGPVVVIHVVPLVSYFQQRPPIDLSGSVKSITNLLPLSGAFNTHRNFEGLVAYPSGAREQAHLQLFRDGSIESVRSCQPRNQVGAPTIHGGVLANHVKRTLADTPAFFLSQGLAGPVLVSVALFRIHLADLWYNDNGVSMVAASAPKHELVVPPQYVEDVLQEQDVQQSWVDALNMLWQAYGLNQCEER
ncbi:ATP-binding protein [Dyella sp. S184]|uniref:AlbA family DNA-binding domain-containing protein n=1 Tax=Dyella sp. S184 TaxID=1641862 RepID=UPI00131D5DCE|nr:ATP-binding protein [Dyella sp. S184]